ncbi:MAG: zinc metalloprotease HtpX [Thermodesulfobacteriota bacterium]
MGNQIKTTLLLAVLTVFIMLIGRLIGGQGGMALALLLAAGMNFFSYWYSDKIVLKMYRAQEAGRNEAPELYEIVSELARRAELPMPRLYIIPQDSPNAFATGRNPDHAVVAVTEGLLRIMDRKEIRGVLAHELSHVKDRDILISSIAATMAGAIMFLANMARWSAIFGGFGGRDQEGGMGVIGLILTSILAPIAAMIVQMAISRSREYLADEEGAKIAGDPEGLASALEKLGAYSGKVPMQANPATSHMFIVNPLSGRSMMHLFSTHPPLEERIARLRGRRASGGRGQRTGNESRGLAAGENMWDRLR